jgi:hypothetical protein
MAILDLSGDRVLFDKAQWIGCGKRFPEFPPANLQVMTNFILLATYTTHTSYEEIQAACRARERPCFRIDTSPGRRSIWTRPYFIRERGNGWTRQVIIF